MPIVSRTRDKLGEEASPNFQTSVTGTLACFRVRFPAAAIYAGAPTCVFKACGIYRPMWVCKNQDLEGATASRQPLPPSPDNVPGGSRHPHRFDEFRPAIP
jgi:hypothetical protein